MRIRRRQVLAVGAAVAALLVLLAGTASATILVRSLGVAHVSPTSTASGSPAARKTPTPRATPTPLPTAASTPAPLPGGDDWTQYRYDANGTGVNPENRLTSANVAQLTTRWVNSTVYGYHPFESTPAELDGVIYVTAGHSLHALDLHTGAELWHYEDVNPGTEPGTVSSSVAVDPTQHIAYYGGTDARIYAVSTVTHLGLWNVQVGDPTQGAYIWSSPLLANGKVYIGLASHEDNPCVRGAIFALNPLTGAIVWTHYTVAAGTIGGGVWSSLSADPDTHEVIATTSNPCPGNDVVDEEDSIIGIDWDTGVTQWQYQAITYDPCDCDFGEGPVIFTYQGTKYVVAGNKLGYEYGLIPPAPGSNTPKLAWSVQLANSGYLGQGGIYEPPTYSNGVIYVAGGPTVDGACQQGALWALQADTGATIWRQCTAGQVVGPSAISGDVLFVGEGDALYAYALGSGSVVWKAAQAGPVWGGVSVARGCVLIGTVPGNLYLYSLPSDP